MTTAIEKMMASLPTHVGFGHASSEGGRQTVTLDFSQKGYGFGAVTFVETVDGLFVDTETMGTEKVIELLRLMLERAVLDVDQDPERHRQYNEVMGRACGSCPVCGAPREVGG
jgi:hypothetical protein